MGNVHETRKVNDRVWRILRGDRLHASILLSANENPMEGGSKLYTVLSKNGREIGTRHTFVKAESLAVGYK